MARDIVGLLTGISDTQQPVPVPGTPGFRGMFGAQQAQKGGAGLGRMARGGQPSNQENIAAAIGNIDLKSAKGLRTMAKVKQIQGDIEGANALNKQALDLENLKPQAKAVADNLPDEYSALKDAIIKNVPGSLEKGVAILGAIKTSPTQPSLVQEHIFAKTPAGGNFKGSLEDWALLRKTKGPTFNLGDQTAQENLKRRLGIQGEMYEKTRPEQEIARNKIASGQSILKTVEDDVFTGVFAETLTGYAEGLENMYALSGVPVPATLQEKVMLAGTIKKAGYDAMLPLIEAQGRGFTDKDREHAKTVLPGLSQSWQYNELAGTLSIIEGNASIEQNRFARKRAMLGEVTDAGGQTLWTQYLEDVPQTKVVNTSRKGLDYKKVQPLKDNEDLSQYWVKERPKGFKVKNDNKIEVMSMSDIKDTANSHGMAVKEFLAALSQQGLLIDGVY